MVKRALCVGCNYPSKALGLQGGVNDALLLAERLRAHCGFEEQNVRVLQDVLPGQGRSAEVEPERQPTRVNILRQLEWVVKAARPGDVLFFSFSGYGCLVDDMDSYVMQGYDEAILPSDYLQGKERCSTVIVASEIHDLLMGIPRGCTATVLMDCDHATSVIDAASGTPSMQPSEDDLCGLRGTTDKVQLAMHSAATWSGDRARAVRARPRFQPLMEVDNARRGRLPTRAAMPRSTPVAFCYSAAKHGQTALEIQVPEASPGEQKPRHHGVLTWSFAQALEELGYSCTHERLLEAIRRRMGAVRASVVPGMDQEALLTAAAPHSDPATMLVFQPLRAPEGAAFGSPTAYSRSAGSPWSPSPSGYGSPLGGTPQGRASDVAAGSLRCVIPPPPPGLIGVGAAGPVLLAGQGLRAPAAEDALGSPAPRKTWKGLVQGVARLPLPKRPPSPPSHTSARDMVSARAWPCRSQEDRGPQAV